MKISKIMSFTNRHERVNEDTAQDVLLLLYLIDKAGNNIFGSNTLDAKIKLMKLAFLAEKEMIEKKYKGFNFFFNIYKRGPSSKELLQLLDDLCSQNLVELDKTNAVISISPKGRATIRDFVESTHGQNKDAFQIVDSIIDKFGKLSTEEIIKLVYAMEMTPMYGSGKINIGQAVKKDERKRLLMKLDKKEAKKDVFVSSNWIETINILMNPAFHV